MKCPDVRPAAGSQRSSAKKPVWRPDWSEPKLSTRPSGVKDACAATRGQLSPCGDSQAPATGSAPTEYGKAVATDATSTLATFRAMARVMTAVRRMFRWSTVRNPGGVGRSPVTGHQIDDPESLSAVPVSLDLPARMTVRSKICANRECSGGPSLWGAAGSGIGLLCKEHRRLHCKESELTRRGDESARVDRRVLGRCRRAQDSIRGRSRATGGPRNHARQMALISKASSAMNGAQSVGNGVAVEL